MAYKWMYGDHRGGVKRARAETFLRRRPHLLPNDCESDTLHTDFNKQEVDRRMKVVESGHLRGLGKDITHLGLDRNYEQLMSPPRCPVSPIPTTSPCIVVTSCHWLGQLDDIRDRFWRS